MTLEQKAAQVTAELAKIAGELETCAGELDAAALDALNAQADELIAQRDAIKTQIERRDALQAVLGNSSGSIPITPNLAPQRDDPLDTAQYRNAFMDFVCRDVQMPQEMRAAAGLGTTTTANVGAVIPTSTLQEMIRELDAYGEIYKKVRKLNVQGGLRVPILTLKPTAKWVGEGASKDQKIAAEQHIEFSYFGLECKVAQTLLVSIVTYEMFQREFVKLCVEAIVKEMERSIMNGSGKGQMLGITVDARVPAGNRITMDADEFKSWHGWKRLVFGKMNKAYRNGVFAMAQGTFDGYIDGMIDTTGQPIGRVTYGIANGEVYRFGGKAVLTVEDDIIVGYDEAAAGDVVAVFFNPTDYAINSQMQLTVTKWDDPDTNERKNKALLVCDGKLLDPHGVLLIVKGSAKGAGKDAAKTAGKDAAKGAGDEDTTQ